MRVTYKAICNLLNNSYAIRSLNEYIHQDTTDDMLNSSILFARDKEQYRYLTVMVEKRADLDSKFTLFISPNSGHPIVLIKDRDLTIVELAILYTSCMIHISEFITLVEATAGNLGLNEQECVENFEGWVEALTSHVNQTA